MKVLLIAIFVFFGSMFCLNSQTLPTYPPCNTDFVGQPCNVPWSLTAKYDTIFYNQLLPQPPSCPTSLNCRFIIQYFERFIKCPGDTAPQWYDVQITFVFTSDTCRQCFADLKTRLEKLFVERRNQAVIDSFRFVWYQPGLNPSIPRCYYQHHFTTKGNCYSQLGDTTVPCSEERCCAKFVKICYDGYGTVLSNLTQISQDLLFPDPILDPTFAQGMPIPCREIGCDTTAKPKCGKYPIIDPEDLLCDSILPCNYGPWQEDSIIGSQALFGCPGCNVWVHYKKRKTTCSGVTYYDIKIGSVSFINDSACGNCPNFNFPAFYWYYVNRIVRREGERSVRRDTCVSDFRVLHYSCWSRSFYDPLLYYPCTPTGCCWTKYMVCKDSNGIVTMTKLDSSSFADSCNTITAPCIYICDEPGMPKISIEEPEEVMIKSDLMVAIKPNPSTGVFNCTINGVNDTELKLVIYNQLGIKVFEKDLVNIKYYINFDFDISKQPVGVYIYSLENNNTPIANGIINLMK